MIFFIQVGGGGGGGGGGDGARGENCLHDSMLIKLFLQVNVVR